MELTCTERVGIHHYQFQEGKDNHVLMDLTHGIYNYADKNVWCFIRMENDTLITGYRQTNGWARSRTVYFAISFSKPITEYGFKNVKPTAYNGFWRKFDVEHNFPEAAGEGLKAIFKFGSETDVHIKVALSSVDIDGALLNLKTECPHWNLKSYVDDAQKKRNE